MVLVKRCNERAIWQLLGNSYLTSKETRKTGPSGPCRGYIWMWYMDLQPFHDVRRLSLGVKPVLRAAEWRPETISRSLVTLLSQ